jgi:hypothetical protein
MALAIATLERVASASGKDVAEGAWQTKAIEHYRRAMVEEEDSLRAELEGRVASLTGRHVTPSLVVVDRDARIAFLTLDGVRFRLQRHHLVLLRPCAYCGTGEFASEPLITRCDLGHALGAWQPLHHDCEIEDPPEW